MMSRGIFGLPRIIGGFYQNGRGCQGGIEGRFRGEEKPQRGAKNSHLMWLDLVEVCFFGVPRDSPYTRKRSLGIKALKHFLLTSTAKGDRLFHYPPFHRSSFLENLAFHLQMLSGNHGQGGGLKGSTPA